MPKMSPNSPTVDLNGKGYESEDEEDSHSDASSLLLPSFLQVQIAPPSPISIPFPPTPTSGIPLRTSWSPHYVSAPPSPRYERSKTSPAGAARARKNSSPHPHSQPQQQQQIRIKAFRSQSRSPTSTGRKAIKWIADSTGHEYFNGKRGSLDLDGGPDGASQGGTPYYRCRMNDGAFSAAPHIIVSPESDHEEYSFSTKQPVQPANEETPYQEEQVEHESRIPAKQTNDENGVNKCDDAKVDVGDEDPMNEAEAFEQSAVVGTPTLAQEEDFGNNDESSNSKDSPTSDPEQPYFGETASKADNTTESSPDEQSGTDYTLRAHGVHQRSETRPFRSTSMVSLEPMDPLMRKTRRNSMLGMMQRVSSQTNVSFQNLPLYIGRSTSKTSIGPNNPDLNWKNEMNESLILCISALYAKLLVVMGMAFPIAEIISQNVSLIFYNSFYLYLYFGSILFLIYAYFFMLRAKSIAATGLKESLQKMTERFTGSQVVSWKRFPLQRLFKNIFKNKLDDEEKTVVEKEEQVSISTKTYRQPNFRITESTNHGSMYLKMGAIIFGIGSMIYSGLEFGQYFELRSDEECANILMAISPVARMIFTFLQMYFIFLNSRVVISKHTVTAQFGMMHMIATNLCIWLNVLVQETKHEIAHLTHNKDSITGTSSGTNYAGNEATLDVSSHHKREVLHNDSDIVHDIVRRATEVDDHFGCRRINLMGHVVNGASPFLFPCTIEYSLLCAGVIYVMWKNINGNKSMKNLTEGDSDISTFIARKVRHHYSVDCARASRGLFMGIFILVLTIISLILFYVLITSEHFKKFAILEANIIELSIYSLSIISVIVGMNQMRELEFILEGDIELDNILLLIAQSGIYIYSSFTIIGGYFSLEDSDTLALITAVMTIVQTTLQTLFILDGSRRCCYTTDQLDRKPGREMVTFLLVCNLAMWAISTFETSRAEVHPTQLQFYGIWAWTIISHVSMPLAIFYRFHVTVCLGEIWKRSYKLKNDFMQM